MEGNESLESSPSHSLHQNGDVGNSRQRKLRVAFLNGNMQTYRALNEDEPGGLINRKLPKELLLRVFSFLDVVTLCRCARVCKYWNLLALDGSNWQKVDLFDFQTDVEGVVVVRIAERCGGFLKQLSLRGCQSVQDEALETFANTCNNIEDLNLNHCKKITNKTCVALSKGCPKLQRLGLDSCLMVTDEGLKALADGCKNLMQLNISWCIAISENGIEALARGCRRLTHFTAKGLEFLTDNSVSVLAKHCPLLEVIDLHSCSNLSDRAVQALGEHCGNLRRICVSGCLHLTDVSLVSIGQGCPYLSTLEVADCKQFTDAGFQALARSCHLLENLDLEDCNLITDATLHHLALGCPRLEKLSLSHCRKITDDGIRALGLAPCSAEHLVVLELDNCLALTDSSLEHLLQCHNLQRIDLYDCPFITAQGIQRLKNHLPSIKVHAYFPPMTPPPTVGGSRQRYCRCCVLL